MKFVSLTVYSIKQKQKLNYFEFKSYGLNLILGEKSLDNDETNGVGKTAMLKSIEYCLGSKIPSSFQGNEILEQLDILFILKIEKNGKYIDIARSVIDTEFIYIYESNNNIVLHEIDLKYWEPMDIDSYKNYIQLFVYNEFKSVDISRIPSFATVREYIIRDEKKGFSDITISDRKQLNNYRILSVLSLMFCDFENDILKQKNEIKSLKAQLKEVDQIGKEIKIIESNHRKTLQEIETLKKIINESDVAHKLEIDETEYYELKKDLQKINIEIRKLSYAKKQHSNSLAKLDANIEKIDTLIELKDFYKEVLGSFPDSVIENFEQMKDFYAFMQSNRGEYVRKQLNAVEKELSNLKSKKELILNKLERNTRLARNTQFVIDMQHITEQLAEKYSEVAEYRYKIDLYSQRKDILSSIQTQENILFQQIENAKKEYNKSYVQAENIINIFNQLNEISYGQVEGELKYEFVDKSNQSANTGRVKITCTIPDDDAHGRYFMKINMFDLAMLINRINQGEGIPFLIHDGSYSKPAQRNKENLLRYIDSYLNDKQYGQYFVTVNVEELSEEFIKEATKNNCIVIRLKRNESNEDRFMGVKY